MNRSSVPPTTHTLEMAQVAELDERLSDGLGLPPVTAASLGMAGAPLHHASAAGPATLADDAVLVRVSWQGSPEFPDIYGHFGRGEDGRPEALLHTAALVALARRLRVRQRWGVYPTAEGGITP